MCVFASRPSCLLSDLSNNMWRNNFYEHFRMLHDWLKNIVRLFSTCLKKETREKLLCHAWKFYSGVSSILQVTSQVMSILRNLERIKARRKANSQETRYDINLTKSWDSVDLSQRTHQVTVPSHSKTLTMKQLGMQEQVCWRSPEVIMKSIPQMSDIILGSMHQSSVKQVLYEGSKRNFHN